MLLLSAPAGTGLFVAFMAMAGTNGSSSAADRFSYPHAAPRRPTEMTAPALTEVVRKSCAASCHSDRRKSGDLSLATYDLANAVSERAVSEKIINKLRTGMMPPPGSRRPGGDTLAVLTEALERMMDAQAVRRPEPGARTFQRLNRAEYERSIMDLLGLQVQAESWLPLDTRSANFDNIADVQTPSATVLDGYLDAASEIARLAVGDAKAGVTTRSYKLPRLASQWDRAPGAPVGTRGGIAVEHTFLADGEYVFTANLHASPTGLLFGRDAPFDEKLEVAVDGERVALLDVDRWMSQEDPQGTDIRTPRIRVRAGTHRIAMAFVQTFEGPVNDNIAPHGHSIADTEIGIEPGITNQPHLREMSVTGPHNPTGVSETASRKRVFLCRPTAPAEARPCATRIVTALASAAYRRPAEPRDVNALLTFYDRGASEGGFEMGIRTAVEAVLASPHFLFRVEEVRAGARAGEVVPISGTDLASRLSFFLWGAPPDEALVRLGRAGTLTTPVVLRAQVRRMLSDPRADALATRFASQWFRLQDIDKVHPDALQYPDFHAQLAADMRTETETFFAHLVRDNRSVMDVFTADYTFLNEKLARHYGIDGVVGTEFRRVSYPDDRRRGVLGHGSVLTLSSHANRTSPVLRGKWVMEVLMGSPPPPPPPNVPDLDKTEAASEGRMLTTRERMEMHRSNPACRSCHLFIDPIGLALDNFDVTGRWRTKENGQPLDTRGTFYDGTEISSPSQLQAVLIKRPDPLLRSFTQNLMAYALGRRVEYADMPAVRRIVTDAKTGGYRMNDLITGVVMSDAFRMTRVPSAADPASQE